MVKSLIFSLSLCILSIKTLSAEASQDTLPKVFTVGEFGKAYEILVSECEVPLNDILGSSMDSTYHHWIKTLNQLERYAEDMQFDIRGVKVWMNIFWAENGDIQHIAYFPKKTSRNIDFKRFVKMLESFIEQYTGNLKHSSCYSHYGSASFPTHADRILNTKN